MRVTRLMDLVRVTRLMCVPHDSPVLTSASASSNSEEALPISAVDANWLEDANPSDPAGSCDKQRMQPTLLDS